MILVAEAATQGRRRRVPARCLVAAGIAICAIGAVIVRERPSPIVRIAWKPAPDR